MSTPLFNNGSLCVQSGPLKEFGYNPFSRVVYYEHTACVVSHETCSCNGNPNGKIRQIITDPLKLTSLQNYFHNFYHHFSFYLISSPCFWNKDVLKQTLRLFFRRIKKQMFKMLLKHFTMCHKWFATDFILLFFYPEWHQKKYFLLGQRFNFLFY